MIPKLVALGRLCLQLGRVNRATFHEDGTRPETDTDHAVMLATVACSFAAEYARHLDLGLVAQFSIVHDHVEAHAGDTMTLVVSDEAGLAAKRDREVAGLEKIADEFGGSLPWLPAMIVAYESQSTPEARFVKILDKVMPCITHLLNGGATLRAHGVGLAQLDAVHTAQRRKLGHSIGYDQPEALHLLAQIHTELLEQMAAAGIK